MNRSDQVAMGQVAVKKLGASATYNAGDEDTAVVAIQGIKESSLAAGCVVEAGFTGATPSVVPVGVTIYGRWSTVATGTNSEVLLYLDREPTT